MTAIVITVELGEALGTPRPILNDGHRVWPVQTEQGVFYKILLSCPIYSNSAPKRKPATKA